MWKYHYENSFNSVKDSCCDIVQFDCVTNNTGKTIDAGELVNIINELSWNKSPSMDGLTSEHIKLCPLFWCMVIYQNQSQFFLLYRLSKV